MIMSNENFVSPFTDPVVRQKAAQTNIERYGVDNPFKLPEVQEKIRQINIEKYGVDNPFKSPEVQARIQEKNKKRYEEQKRIKEEQKRIEYENLPFVEPDWDAIKGTRSASEEGIRLHYPKFYQYIIENYPQDVTFKERIWMYRNGTKEKPVCKVCGGPVRFVKSTNYYTTYCSKKCANRDPDKKEKTKQVLLEKYGVEYISQSPEIKEKIKQTCIEKYGVEYASQSPEIRERVEKTCLKKYGRKYYNNQEKARKTWMEKYGVDHPSKSKEVMERKRQTNLAHFGLEWSCQLPSAKISSNDSKPNKMFAEILKNNGIEFEREFPIENRSYDFKVGDILIEINPSVTHNSTFGVFDGKPTEKQYHKNKSLLAQKHGYHCIHIWDWDYKVINIIVNNLKPRTNIYARNTEIRVVPKEECDVFLTDNHIQGTCKGQKIIYGLYKNNELMEVMSFGKPRYNRKYQYELLRLCTKCGYNVIGGTERLFSHFIKENNPASVISYCDRSKFSGYVYNKLGFTPEKRSEPSKHWYSLKNGRHITDNLLRQRGFDQIFKTQYGKGTSNDELMRQHGFVEIYDCGQITYTYKNEKTLS